MERDTNQCRVLYTMRTLGIIDLGMSPGTFGLELSPRCGSAGVTPEEAISILLDFLLCLFCKGQNSHVHNQTAKGREEGQDGHSTTTNPGAFTCCALEPRQFLFAGCNSYFSRALPENRNRTPQFHPSTLLDPKSSVIDHHAPPSRCAKWISQSCTNESPRLSFRVENSDIP
mgnify:CR=1 FL=1